MKVVVCVPEVNVPLFVQLPGATVLPERVKARLLALKVVPVAIEAFPLIVAAVFNVTVGVPVALTLRLGKTFVTPKAVPTLKFGEPDVDAFPNCTVPPVILTVPAADMRKSIPEATFCIIIVPPLILNDDVVPVVGISKLAIELEPLGGVVEPIAVVRVPPLMLNVITLVEVALTGANLAAIFKAPPSIVKTELLPHINELLVVPTLYVPAVILNNPLRVVDCPCAVTVTLALFSHIPSSELIVTFIPGKNKFVKVYEPDILSTPRNNPLTLAPLSRKEAIAVKFVGKISTILLGAVPELLIVMKLKSFVPPPPLKD